MFYMHAKQSIFLCLVVESLSACDHLFKLGLILTFHGQPMPTTVPTAPHPPAMRPRVRARRGQATDPHSIAERLRRERIAERIRALQELVPSVNKTDRAAILDEIVDMPY